MSLTAPPVTWFVTMAPAPMRKNQNEPHPIREQRPHVLAHGPALIPNLNYRLRDGGL